MGVAVVLLIFRRPEHTRLALERIRAARPERLYVVADGPRPDREGEAELCAAARREALAVDWPCDVRTDFAETNLGLKRRIASGLTAVFEKEERAIIVEDDCLLDPTFFPFAEDLLERYAEDERVMCIAAQNVHAGHRFTSDSYFFSIYPHCWGWATWRRAWRRFDVHVSAWAALRDGGWALPAARGAPGAAFWRPLFDELAAGRLNSWATAWTLACWAHGGLTAIPETNLVHNNGFAVDGTHSRDLTSPLSRLRTHALALPLRHPEFVLPHGEADRRARALMFRPRPLWRRALSKLKRIMLGAP